MVEENAVYLFDVFCYQSRGARDLHLGEDALDLDDVQQVASVFVGLEESHHGLGFEGVELVEPIVVHLCLPDEQDHSDPEDVLLVLRFEGESETVQGLSVQYEVVSYIVNLCLLMPKSFSFVSVENSLSVML